MDYTFVFERVIVKVVDIVVADGIVVADTADVDVAAAARISRAYSLRWTKA